MSDSEQVEGKEAIVKRRAQIPKTLIPLIKESYLNGEGSMRELSIKYNVSQRALEVRCSRENWRIPKEQVVQKVCENVQKREDLRFEMLRSHEVRMVSRMEKRLVSVDKTLDQSSDLLEPQELRAIVSTESVIDQVIRRNLGAEEKVSVSGELSVNVVAILEKIRGMNRPAIDLEAEETELGGCKLVEG